MCARVWIWWLRSYIQAVDSVCMREYMCIRLDNTQMDTGVPVPRTCHRFVANASNPARRLSCVGSQQLGPVQWWIETGVTRHSPIHFREVVAKDCETSLWQTWRSAVVARTEQEKPTRLPTRKPIYQRSVRHSNVSSVKIGGFVLLGTRVAIMRGKSHVKVCDVSHVCAKEWDTDPMFYTGETSSNKSTMRPEVVFSCSKPIINALFTDL